MATSGIGEGFGDEWRFRYERTQVTAQEAMARLQQAIEKCNEYDREVSALREQVELFGFVRRLQKAFLQMEKSSIAPTATRTSKLPQMPKLRLESIATTSQASSPESTRKRDSGGFLSTLSQCGGLQ